jgi:hypothetical protein
MKEDFEKRTPRMWPREHLIRRFYMDREKIKNYSLRQWKNDLKDILEIYRAVTTITGPDC